MSTCPHNIVNFGPLTAEICWRVWCNPANFNGFSHLGFVTATASFTRGQPNFARCLAVSWTGTLCIHFRGLLPPDRILRGAKFTFRPSLAFAYWQRYSTALKHAAGVSQTLQRRTRNGITELSQRASPICVRAAITLGIGPHSSLF